ncbi:MAG: GrpB family protein [Rickettsiales bacterium]|nr:GrpB family protein [Rickettsiales bacterium]
MSKIQVVSYNERWPYLFREESQKIKDCLGNNFIEIHHVGSTSVKGLCAKPRIDIIIIAKDIILASKQLESLYYRARGEVNIPFHQYLKKDIDECGYNLHIYEKNNPEIKLNLMFRDFLRENPSVKREYSQLKFDLVRQEKMHAKTIVGFAGYNLGKNAFITNIINKTGFNEICMRYCIHYTEWENYHRIIKQQLFLPKNVPYDYTNELLNKENEVHFVFYKGTKIIGAAYVNLEDLNIYDIATDHDANSYFNEVKSLLERWVLERQNL